MANKPLFDPTVPRKGTLEGTDEFAIHDGANKIGSLNSIKSFSNDLAVANRAAVTNAQGVLTTSTVKTAELDRLIGVTSPLQTQLNSKLNEAGHTASKVVVSNGSGNITTSSISTTSLGYLTDVTSNIQAQLDSKLSDASLTANRAVVSDGSGDLSSSTVTDTEVSYLSGVTSNIQTQLDSKVVEHAFVTSLLAASDGIIVKNGNTALSRSIAGVSNEIKVSNGNGIAGNMTIGLPDESVSFPSNTSDSKVEAKGAAANKGLLIDAKGTGSVLFAHDNGSGHVGFCNGSALEYLTVGNAGDNTCTVTVSGLIAQTQASKNSYFTGKLGLGSSATPNTLLNLFNGDLTLTNTSTLRPKIFLEEAAGGKQIAIEYCGAGSGTANYLRIGSDATGWTTNALYYIPANGNFGIGEINPDKRLHVAGSAVIDIYNARMGGDTNAGLYFRDLYNDNMVIRPRGYRSTAHHDGLEICGYDGVGFRIRQSDVAEFYNDAYSRRGLLIGNATVGSWIPPQDGLAVYGNVKIGTQNDRSALTLGPEVKGHISVQELLNPPNPGTVSGEGKIYIRKKNGIQYFCVSYYEGTQIFTKYLTLQGTTSGTFGRFTGQF